MIIVFYKCFKKNNQLDQNNYDASFELSNELEIQEWIHVYILTWFFINIINIINIIYVYIDTITDDNLKIQFTGF